MQSVKALVIEHDKENLQSVEDAMAVLEHDLRIAASLTESYHLLEGPEEYAYILLADEVPLRAGRKPLRQNAENFMARLAKIRVGRRPPVILMVGQMNGVSDIDKMRRAADLRSRGVVDFIENPLPNGGRTLERVVTKVLEAQAERVRLARLEMDAPVRGNIIPLGPLPPVIKQAMAAVVGRHKSAEKPGRQPQPANRHASADTKPKAPPAVIEDRPANDNKPALLPPQWAAIPNEPIGVDSFMARFCESKGKEHRVYRKRALLAAARHGTITLPPLAAERKLGQPNKYWTHDLLREWQGYRDEGVELPAVVPQYLAEDTTVSLYRRLSCNIR